MYYGRSKCFKKRSGLKRNEDKPIWVMGYPEQAKNDKQ